jgi:hypothetical protein
MAAPTGVVVRRHMDVWRETNMAPVSTVLMRRSAAQASWMSSIAR